MGRIILILFLLSKLSFANQLITNGEILFYYDREQSTVNGIKGNIFSDIDVASINIGLIIGSKHYYLKDFIFENLVIPKENMVESSGAIKGIPFSIIYSFVEGNKFSVNLKVFPERVSNEKLTAVFQIIPQRDNGFMELTADGNYKYDDKIIFRDSKKAGEMYISPQIILDGEHYITSKITGSSINYVDLQMYYFVPLEENELTFLVDFIHSDSDKFNRLRSMENRISDNWRKVQGEQLAQLNYFLERTPVPSEISYNIPQKDYLNELSLKYIGTTMGMARIDEILEKNKPSILEKIYYDLTIFKIIHENSFLESSGKEFYNKTKEYVDIIFDEVYEEGSISQVYYMCKLLDYLIIYSEKFNERDSNRYIMNKFLLEKIANTEFYSSSGIKSSRYSAKGEAKNVIYADIFSEKIKKEILERELRENFSRDYQFFIPIQNRNKIESIDLEYNLNMVIFLYEMEERKRADILLGKIEELIAKNNFYIPKYYQLGKINENGIYGIMIWKYFKAVLEGER